MAINVKNKVGRPKKVRNDAGVIMKSDLEIKLEKLEAILAVKDVFISDLEKVLDNAYKKEILMFSEIEKVSDMIQYHCQKVQENTGLIELEDVCYSANLLERIMKHKFEHKSQNWEQ